jgi:hypothetical protein
VAETAVGVGPWVVNVALGRHLAKCAAVGVAVNWVGAAICTRVRVVRVVRVLRVVGVVRVLQVVGVGVVGVSASAGSYGTRSAARQTGATNSRRWGY